MMSENVYHLRYTELPKLGMYCNFDFGGWVNKRRKKKKLYIRV